MVDTHDLRRIEYKLFIRYFTHAITMQVLRSDKINTLHDYFTLATYFSYFFVSIDFFNVSMKHSIQALRKENDIEAIAVGFFSDSVLIKKKCSCSESIYF